MTHRRVAFVVPLAVASTVLAGCGDSLSEEEAEVACANVSVAVSQGRGIVDPLSIAQDAMQEEFGMSPSEATDAVREAVSDHCPELRNAIE